MEPDSQINSTALNPSGATGDQRVAGSVLQEPAPAKTFGTISPDAESFRNIPHDSETFGKLPKDSEAFRTIPHVSERRENHTLSVREVARLFETAGVARTERSITNWCQRNKMGIARLDSYFDPNERKYFITRESADMAIQEEKAKAAKASEQGSVDVPKPSEPAQRAKEQKESRGESEEVWELQKKLRDLEITNRVKDQVIERLETSIEKERHGFVSKLIQFSRKVGQLETKLFQVGAGGDPAKAKELIHEGSEEFPI